MANRSQLRVVAGRGRVAPSALGEWVLGANYVVPVLWLASLEPEELALHVEPDDEFPDEPTRECYASVPATKAARRCKARQDALRAIISNVDDFLPRWRSLLERLSGKRIVVCVSEILDMMEERSPLETLQQAISFVEAPSKRAAVAFMRVTCLGDVYDPATHRVATPAARRVAGRSIAPTPAEHHVMGYKVARWVPWKEPA